MKKTLFKSVSLLLAAILVFSLASCSNNSGTVTGLSGYTENPDITGSEQPTADESKTEASTVVPLPSTTAENEPATNKSSGSIASIYSPVYSIKIGNENIRSATTTESFVPSNLRSAYYTVLNGIKKYEQTIKLKNSISVDNMKRIIIYLRDLNPELFYIDWTTYSYSTVNDGKDVVSLTFTYINPSPSSQAKALESIVSTIVSKANSLSNSFERELYVHDYLVNNVTYTTATANCGSAYGALVEGKARCEGYARAFELIMNRLGITTVVISGFSEGERHMWNAVELYGKYYYVDVTFDDNSSENYKTSYSEDEITHSCFNVPAEVLTKTHQISEIGSSDTYGSYQNLVYPTCNSFDYNYYRVRGLMITTLEQFKYVLTQNKSKKTASVFFYGSMPSVDNFKNAFDEFFKVNYPLNGYNIQFTPSDTSIYKRNVFEISWTVK